jgi:hypothetical protein
MQPLRTRDEAAAPAAPKYGDCWPYGAAGDCCGCGPPLFWAESPNSRRIAAAMKKLTLIPA